MRLEGNLLLLDRKFFISPSALEDRKIHLFILFFWPHLDFRLKQWTQDGLTSFGGDNRWGEKKEGKKWILGRSKAVVNMPFSILKCHCMTLDNAGIINVILKCREEAKDLHSEENTVSGDNNITKCRFLCGT